MLLTAFYAFGPACANHGRGAEIAGELGRVKFKSLEEVSGAAFSRQNEDVLWLHNDGETKHLYAVNLSGKVLAQLRVPVRIEDLEDVALGPGPETGVDYLYLGDVGDNDAQRREIQVIRFAEPKLAAGEQPRVTQVDVIRLRYPDGSHNAEALMVDPRSGNLVIVTKDDAGARVYAAAAQGAGNGLPTMLEPVAELNVPQVSAGDISSDGRRLALRREDRGWLWERQPGEALAAALSAPPREIPVLGRRQGKNGESLAFDADGGSYVTISEGKNQRIYRFAVPAEEGSSGELTQKRRAKTAGRTSY